VAGQPDRCAAWGASGGVNAKMGTMGLRELKGAAYRARLAELERLATARVADLTRPGQVLLELAARGFGVRLPPDPKP
jgi:hypothetical protein